MNASKDLINLVIAGTAVAIFWLGVWFVDPKLAAAPPQVKAGDRFPYFKLESSVRHVLFWQEGKQRVYRGDWVELENIPDPRIGESIRLVKRTVCTGGDQLLVMGRDYFCRHDGETEYLGAAQEKDSAGLPLYRFIPLTAPTTPPHLAVNTIPPGKLFVIGDHRQSYDSRYFGYLDEVRHVRNVLRPLL